MLSSIDDEHRTRHSSGTWLIIIHATRVAIWTVWFIAIFLVLSNCFCCHTNCSLHEIKTIFSNIHKTRLRLHHFSIFFSLFMHKNSQKLRLISLLLFHRLLKSRSFPNLNCLHVLNCLQALSWFWAENANICEINDQTLVNIMAWIDYFIQSVIFKSKYTNIFADYSAQLFNECI